MYGPLVTFVFQIPSRFTEEDTSNSYLGYEGSCIGPEQRFFLDCPIQSTIKKRGIESFLFFFFSPLHSIINHKSLSQLTPHPYLSASSDPAHFQFNIKLFRRVNKVFPLRCQKERQSRFHFTKCTSSTSNLKIS